MRKFRCISLGTDPDLVDGWEHAFSVGNIYFESELERDKDVEENILYLLGEDWLSWYCDPNCFEEVVDEQVISNTFSNKVDKVLNNVREVLITKNEKYGDSALNPIRIFSTVDSTEQIKVRIDDKLSRIKNYNGNLEDEDVVTDLIGYLVLLKISKIK